MKFNLLSTIMRNKIIFLVLITFSVVFNSFSQETTMHPKTIQFSTEVFKDCMQYTQQQYLMEYSKQISQVSIIELPENKRQSLPFLSQVPLKNKCNSQLVRDELNFDNQNFNPLKYFFNFYSENDQYIQVDNTSYVILISRK
jgi:hypothetical protein